MTLQEAKGLKCGDVLHHVKHKNADGTPQRWRINGKVKTWKRDAGRVKVPLKHGLYLCDYLDEDCLDILDLVEE